MSQIPVAAPAVCRKEKTEITKGECNMSIYDSLNPMQKEAVMTTEGPVLMLAGAGSGKTRALTHRICYLIEEKKVNPWNILAITFTNKAAAEMRERVDHLVKNGAESIWVATFHSTCVRILRRYIERLGYSSNFTIYDTDDQKTLLKQAYKKLDIDPKLYKERTVLSAISDAKNKMISPEEMSIEASGDYRKMQVASLYTEYQALLKNNNALDFDDLLVKTVELFQNDKEVLEYYQNRFRYIMVDEYQDTNGVQFQLIKLLADKYKNICVVGDDDQSIYKFRGADIGNILSFEDSFPGAKVIKLEQNYRSTQNILDAANWVIQNNKGRKEKRLWTENEKGSLVKVSLYDTAYDEADAVIEEIQRAKERGISLKECAVLYRTNAQSRILEEKCVSRSVPYRLVGGVNFYQRKEIKDILAYLHTIDNGQDDLAVQRIINVPKRGIGAATQGKVAAFAAQEELSFFEALTDWEAIPGIGKAGLKLESFAKEIRTYRKMEQELPIADLIDLILEGTGYEKELLAAGDDGEAQSRLENIQELKNKAIEFEEQANEEVTLGDFLEEVSLVADIDSMDENEERLTLMTLHSAKGLEFEKVILSGMEDGLFPNFAVINDVEHPEEMEEERRLFYVGITRAKKELTMTAARQRMVNGETRFGKLSRFVEEIPGFLIERQDGPSLFTSRMKPSWGGEENSLSFGGKQEGGRQFSYRNTKPYTAPGASYGAAAGMGKQFTVKRAGKLDYKEGDRVRHIKFGEGTVLKIENGAKDYEVTVNFDKTGQRKLYASFAKLTLC